MHWTELFRLDMWQYTLAIGDYGPLGPDQNRWAVFWCRWRGHIWSGPYPTQTDPPEPFYICDRCGDEMY